MSIDVRSPEVLELIDIDAQVEQLCTGFQFTEGPLWNAESGCLLFSDIPANQIKKWTPDAEITDFRFPSGKSNGLTYDKQGRLLACEGANRRVSRTEADGTVVTLVSHYNGKRLNSPNDVIVKSDGSVYFTDPPYGLSATYGVDEDQELDFQGVYRVSPDGHLTLMTDEFYRPNGLCFSPDESILYIDDSSDLMLIRAYDVQPDGTITNGRLFAELSGENGAPDGMKVDQRGNLYSSGPGGIWIFAPSGKHLGIIRTPELAANLAWGGDDWKTLFITATNSIYQVQCKVGGIPLP